jgi:hypothetical protein
MENCDKYKKKALVGFVLLIFDVFIIRIIDLELCFPLEIIIPIFIFIGFFGLYLGLPYLRCLTDNNKIGKPPF